MQQRSLRTASTFNEIITPCVVISYLYWQPTALITPKWACCSKSRARATQAPLCREEEMDLITATMASAPAVLPGGSGVAAVTAPPVITASSGLWDPLWPQVMGGFATQLGTGCTQSCRLQPCGRVCMP